MSPAFIQSCAEHMSNTRITFHKFHVVFHADAAVNKMRRIEQLCNKSFQPVMTPSHFSTS